MRTKKRGRLRRHLKAVRVKARKEREQEFKLQLKKVESFGKFIKEITGE
jgi:hypothetical protein